VIPLHFGELHAFEQVLVLVIALGPFIVLGIAVHVVRKRDLAAEHRQEDPDGQS
jgi:hypothetical protein